MYNSNFIKAILFYITLLAAQNVSAQVDIDNTLIAHYSFNGHTLDIGENELHATITTDEQDAEYDGIPSFPTLTDDRFGNCSSAFLFDSFRESISLPHEVLDQKMDFTFSIWIYPTAIARGRGIISATNPQVDQVNGNEYHLVFYNDRNLRAIVKENEKDFSPTFVPNTWYHLVLTREGSTGRLELFVNGNSVGSRTSASGSLNISPGALHLGSDLDCVEGCWEEVGQFYGKLDDVRFYEGILDPEEVEKLYSVTEQTSGSIDLISDRLQVCQGQTATVDAGSGFDSYLWSNGSTAQAIEVGAAGTYTVTVTQGTCSFTDEVEVVLIDGLELADQQSICQGQTATIDAGAGYDSYLWSNGSTTQAIEVGAAGIYSVTVTQGSCSFTDEVEVIEAVPPQISTSVSQDCAGGQVILEVMPPVGGAILWPDSSTGSKFTATSSGEVEVKFIYPSCELSSTIEVELYDYEQPLSNLVTRNSDGANDLFTLPAPLTGAKVTIYNRWGDRIFKAEQYQNDWPSEVLPAGVYFYTIEVDCLPDVLKGTVHVVK